MLQVQPLQEADRARPGVGRAIPAERPLLLQRLPGNGAQPLQRLRGASHRHGLPLPRSSHCCALCHMCVGNADSEGMLVLDIRQSVASIGHQGVARCWQREVHVGEMHGTGRVLKGTVVCAVWRAWLLQQ